MSRSILAAVASRHGFVAVTLAVALQARACSRVFRVLPSFSLLQSAETPINSLSFTEYVLTVQYLKDSYPRYVRSSKGINAGILTSACGCCCVSA